MKFALSILISLITQISWAFEYRVHEEKLLNPSIFDAYEIGQHFKQRGFTSLSDTSLIKAGFRFDQAFVSYNWEKSLLLKAGLEAPKEMEGKIISAGVDMWVIHFTHQETPYMLLSLGLTKEEFKNAVKPWLKGEEHYSFFSLLIPTAHAEECDPPNQNLQGLDKVMSEVEKNQLMSKIAQCGLDALKQVKNAAEDGLEFFRKLATDPTAVWSETKESFVALKNFVLNIQSELQSTYQNLQEIDFPDKLELACMATGALVGKATQAMMTGPTGLLRVMPLLLLQLRKTTSMLAQMGRLKKKGMKINTKKMANEVMRCEP